MEPAELLKKYFGYDTFRPMQEDVIKTILSGRDVLAVMPTGAGKSVCFQIPALLFPHGTIIISPLISLMKDQVEALAMFCARAVEELGLSVSDIYTHAEMAAFDGYGIGSGDPDMRWDLLYVPDYGDGGRLVPGGELIRGKTKYYRKQRSGLLCL